MTICKHVPGYLTFSAKTCDKDADGFLVNGLFCKNIFSPITYKVVL